MKVLQQQKACRDARVWTRRLMKYRLLINSKTP